MKRAIALLLSVLMLVAVFTGCGKKEAGSSSDKGDDKPYIAIISMGFQHQFWQAVKQGAEKAAEEFGATITFEGPESETMVDKQVEMLKTAIARNPDAICIAAIDSAAVLPDLEAAAKKGIKIIGFDSGVEGDIALTTCATDNIAASALAAKHMAELIGGKGEIGMIIHSQTAVDGAMRRDGFKNYIEENYPDIKIVDIQYADGDHLKSADAAKAMIQAYPNLKGIYGSNEGSAVGAMNGADELNRTDLVIVGFDSGALIKNGIKNGKMAGAITQDPIGIGYKSVEYAIKAIKGEELPKVVDTGAYWYDATNIDSEQIAPLLYD
ncbi:MAG TPA: ABC transporter substrate-binding protein [Clostridiaceae bacterium]|nr:ABC transporter substrate-binding protein [Clostridiaceae bacterium]